MNLPLRGQEGGMERGMEAVGDENKHIYFVPHAHTQKVMISIHTYTHPNAHS